MILRREHSAHPRVECWLVFNSYSYIEENHAHKLASRAAEGADDGMRGVMSFWGISPLSTSSTPF